MSEQRRVISSARLIAACTLASRVSGMLRDMLLVQMLGLTWVADAFNYGFQFPNLFRRLFGEGALAAVFVPRFTHALEDGGRPGAERLLARTRALLVTALLVVIALIELILATIWLSTPADDPRRAYDTVLLLALTAIMLPFMLTVCLLALYGSVLNCLNSFLAPAAAPVLLNLVMIAAILGSANLDSRTAEQRAFVVAISVPAAGVLQLLGIGWVLRRRGLRIGWELKPRDTQVRGLVAMMGPVLLGQGALLLSTFLDVQICALLTRTDPRQPTAQWFGLSLTYPLEAGALSAVTVAQRLYQFPLGVLVISLATAALPAFSRLAARSEWSEWSAQVRATLRLALFEGLGVGALMIVLAEPIVRLLFEYGRFGPQDTERAAHVLRCYGAGMWAFCAQHIVLRGFYSAADVRTPVLIACALLPVNLALTLVLIWVEGVREAAFALSSAATSALSVVLGILCLQRRTGRRLFDAATAASVARMAIAAGLAAAVAVIARGLWQDPLARLDLPVPAARAVDTLGALALGVIAYLLLSRAAGLAEVALLVRTPRRPV